MSRAWILRGLIAAILLQVGVLAVEYLNSVYPLWTGQEIRLRTVPVDPRSLFRGNYTRLNYDISRITLSDTGATTVPRYGEVVYVKLKQGEKGLYEFDGASLSPPQQGLFIRGRIQARRWLRGGTYPVRYGIEAYFAPKKKALELEKQLRDGGVAVIMLADNGKAALKAVIGEPGAD